jgi:hypothetical protein
MKIPASIRRVDAGGNCVVRPAIPALKRTLFNADICNHDGGRPQR